MTRANHMQGCQIGGKLTLIPSLLPGLAFFFFFTSASYGLRTVRALCCTVYMSFSFFIFSPLLTKLVKLVFFSTASSVYIVTMQKPKLVRESFSLLSLLFIELISPTAPVTYIYYHYSTEAKAS